MIQNYFFKNQCIGTSFTSRLKECATNRIACVSLIFFALIVVSSCSDTPPSDFYEVDGLISGEATDMSGTTGWEPVQFINSIGLKKSIPDSATGAPISFSVNISTSGEYAIWLLGAHPVPDRSSTLTDISITGPDGFLLSRSSVEIPKGYKLKWIRAGTNNSDLISFETAGQYTFTITPRSPEDIQIHKIQMSLNNADQPFGLGLPSSTRTDLSASDIFREIPVMLPPSWAFEPVLGSDEHGFQSLTEWFLRDESINPAGIGAFWSGSGLKDEYERRMPSPDDAHPVRGIKIDSDTICTGNAESVFDSGYQFMVTHESLGVECLSRLHREYQNLAGDDQRSVFFHGIKNAFNATIKQYPAPITPLYTFAWSAKPFIEEGDYKPGGYRELVGDLSDPAGSLYNMPFVSMPLDYSSVSPVDSDWDSELFIRSLQLSPFLPVMNIKLPAYFSWLSRMEKEQFKNAVDFRNSIFPYSYTHAHYTRQTNESVISGFRQHPDQFLYGDAFLVAPVMAPGSNGRIVYFPEGRRWYNYYSGDVFEAGRSWFVETQLDQLPLFVKAGSVIPYQVSDDPEHLQIEIYTGDAGAFRLVEDDGETRAYRRADAARTMFRYNEIEGNLKLTIGAVQADFKGMSDQRSYDIFFKHAKEPERVEINGEELVRSQDNREEKGWRYDAASGDVIVTLNRISRREKKDIVIYL